MASLRERILALRSSPERLLWAVRVRWLVIVGFVSLVSLAHGVGLFPAWRHVVAVGVLGAGLNAFNGWCVRHRRFVFRVSLVALPMDHLLTTYLVAQTGGSRSPFVVVYAVQVLATAMLVDTAVAFASAVLAVALWACALWAQAAGYLAVTPISPVTAVAPYLLEATWATFLFYSLVLVTYLGGYISDRLRSSERDLRDRNRSLEEAVSALGATHAQLVQAHRRLKETEAQLVHAAKMRGLGALVAGVAHELNNPISFVTGNLEHLRAYCAGLLRLVDAVAAARLSQADAERLRQLREEIRLDAIRKDLPLLLDDCEEGARRTRQIVGGLRDFSRVDTGEAWAPADVRRGMDSTLALVAHRYRQRILVHKRYEDVPEVECNLGQLNQVFLNLLLNAADACGERKGEVWVTIRAAGREASACVEVEVRDNGSGIGGDVLPRIFEPFFTTKAVGKGSGLGLSVSYGIVRRHHGDIRVESGAGGTTFTVTLPLAQPPTCPASAVDAPGWAEEFAPARDS